MDTNKVYSSVAAAARDFFGARPGVENTATNWMAEYKQLTDADKAEIKIGLIQNGYQFSV